MTAARTAAAILALVAIGVPAGAAAFRTLADDDPSVDGPVRWEPTSVPLAIFELPPRGILLTDAHRALQLASSSWTVPDCSGVAIPTVTVTSDPAAQGDGRIIVEALRSEWRERGFSADVAATTDLLLEQRDGAWVIADGDVLVNDVDYEWAATPQSADSSIRDLRSVLTHELGHGIAGLVHPCEHGIAGAPDCSSSPAFAETTMFPDYLGDVQSSLSEDDIAGVCSVYPSDGCEAMHCLDGEVCVGGDCRALCNAVVCGSGDRCEAGACTPQPCDDESCPPPRSECGTGEAMCGSALLGDPCTADAECETGLCSASSGACAMSCARGPAACPAGYECIDSACEPSSSLFGVECTHASDCGSQLCLDTGDAAYCTHMCGPMLACPPGYDCTDVEARPVCAPIRISCAAAPGSRRGITGLGGVALALFLSCCRRYTKTRGAP